MGDRANFGFRQADGDTIFLYGHWAGYGMMARLAQAIEVARPRWRDESYATRIAISNLIGEEWNQEYSWGISTYIGDNEHSIPVVEWCTERVILYSRDGLEDNDIKFVMDFDSFLSKFAKDLTYA
jgi:hypothetical protein